MNLKRVAILGVATLSTVAMTACSNKTTVNSSDKKNKGIAALVTDGHDVDDHSSQQSAWAGTLSYSKEHNLKRGASGYQYLVTGSAASCETNPQEVSESYDLVFDIGYELKDAVSSIAKKSSNKKFAITDETIKGQENVVSVNSLSNRTSYSAGVTAVYGTKTNIIGFIGGIHGDIVGSFDTGLTKDVNDTAKRLGKEITILNQHIGDSNSNDKAKTTAQIIHAREVDTITHATSGAGDGLFEEAKAINQTRKTSGKVWAIGVDTDQSNLGNYKLKNGKKPNFVLISVITGVSIAVKDIVNRACEGKFPSDKGLIYGLGTNDISTAKDQISNRAWKASRTVRIAIIDGKISVPKHPNK